NRPSGRWRQASRCWRSWRRTMAWRRIVTQCASSPASVARDQSASFVDEQKAHILRAQECRCPLALEHRDRCVTAGEDRKRRDDARRLPTIDGHSGSGIEQMAVALPVELDVAFV